MKTEYIKLYDKQTVTLDNLREMDISIDSIRIDGRIGKWSAIDLLIGYSESGNTGDNSLWSRSIAMFALFEHDYYGDMTDYVVAYFDYYSGDNIWKEIDGTFDDLHQALIDFECIDD